LNEKGHAIKTCPKIDHKASIRASKVTIQDHGNTGSSKHWDNEVDLDSVNEEEDDESDDSSTE